MDAYLKGFNDGYNKALEQLDKGNIATSIQVDGKEIAKDITEVQERQKRIQKTF